MHWLQIYMPQIWLKKFCLWVDSKQINIKMLLEALGNSVFLGLIQAS